jgi:hypothetical protein
MPPRIPFACNMNALTATQRAKHKQLEETLRSTLIKAHDLTDGYDFEFPLQPALYNCLTEISPLEHACCPFFIISTRLDHDRLFWQLTGTEGVKDFIRMEFGGWFK